MRKLLFTWALFQFSAGVSFAQSTIAGIATDETDKQAVETIVSEKILHTFWQLFPNAEHTQWSEGLTFYEAQFFSGATRIHVCIDSSGNWLRTIRYYKEGLPSNLLLKIRQKYANREIFGITEITDELGVNYEIIVHDPKYIYRITANSDGIIQRTQRLKRASS